LARFSDDFPDSHFSPSAINLVQYLALRRQDLRDIQDRLVAQGLSSLGRGESHILDNLNRVIGLFAHSAATMIHINIQKPINTSSSICRSTTMPCRSCNNAPKDSADSGAGTISRRKLLKSSMIAQG
jgi:hypothetical protein